jgi:hypothetical protein
VDETTAMKVSGRSAPASVFIASEAEAGGRLALHAANPDVIY